MSENNGTNDYSYTDDAGGTFTASSLGEGMVKLMGTYPAPWLDVPYVRVTAAIEFRAADVSALTCILQQAANDAATSFKGVVGE